MRDGGVNAEGAHTHRKSWALVRKSAGGAAALWCKCLFTGSCNSSLSCRNQLKESMSAYFSTPDALWASARAECGMRPLRCRPSEPQSRALLALLRRVGAADAAERLGPAIVADLAYTAAIQVAQDWLRRDDLTPAMCAFRPQAAGTAAIDVVQVSADFDGMSPQKKAFYYKVWSRLSPPNRAWLVMTAT